jgi:hypothetical protein
VASEQPEQEPALEHDEDSSGDEYDPQAKLRRTLRILSMADHNVFWDWAKYNVDGTENGTTKTPDMELDIYETMEDDTVDTIRGNREQTR